MDVGGAFEAMVRAVRNDGRPGAVGYAISAVDVALWDLKARLLGVSLPRLLGAVRSEVPVYGSGGFTTYSDRQLHDQLSGWAQVSGHCAPHLYAAAATAVPNLRHLEWFHDYARIESMFFDEALDPAGGSVRPDPDAPGLGLTLRAADAERYRTQ